MPDHTVFTNSPDRRALSATVYATNTRPVPAVDVRAILSDSILALNTLANPEGTTDEDWAGLVEVRNGEGATVQALARVRDVMPTVPFRVESVRELALTLLTMHEDEAVSLDSWVEAREVVEAFFGPIVPNGV